MVIVRCVRRQEVAWRPDVEELRWSWRTGSARIEGDLRTARLQVAEGAVFIGHCVVGQDAAKDVGKDVQKPPQTAGPAGGGVDKSKGAPELIKK